MMIRIYKGENSKFSIHPGEELAGRIANLLQSKDFCRVTNMLTRAMGHSVAVNIDSQPTKWTGLVDGYIVDESTSVKDIAELLSKEFELPLHTIVENEEFLITDEEDAIF